MIIILIFPILGGLLYLIFGDNRMGKKFYKKAEKVSNNIDELNQAKHYIFMEYFIIEQGKMCNI